MASFVRMRSNQVNVPGVKTSTQNGQKLASTGNSGLDLILGNGQEIGSLLLIGEDKHGRYSKVITKLWLSEGVTHNHKIFLANLDENPEDFIKEIPAAIENTESQKPQSARDDEELRIAFRYSSLPKINSESSSTMSATTNYDLSKKYDPEKLEKTENISYFSYKDYLAGKSSGKNQLEALYEKIRMECELEGDNLLRICLTSVGSPFWYTDSFGKDLINFLRKLKALIRYHKSAICLISMPTHLIDTIDNQLIYQIRNLVDSHIALESFDENTNPYYKEYNGQLFIKKLQTINALQSPKPETYDLAFKLKRNRFLIEKLHAPQILLDSDPREEGSGLGCGSNKKSLDF